MLLETSSAARGGHSDGRRYDREMTRAGEACIPATVRWMTPGLVKLCEADQRCDDTTGDWLVQVLRQEDVLRVEYRDANEG